VFEAIVTATTIQVIVDGIAGSEKGPGAPLGSPNSLFGKIEHTDDFVIGKICVARIMVRIAFSLVKYETLLSSGPPVVL